MESLSDKILIVDDDENISEILNMYLEDRCIKVGEKARRSSCNNAYS